MGVGVKKGTYIGCLPVHRPINTGPSPRAKAKPGQDFELRIVKGRNGLVIAHFRLVSFVFRI